MGLAVPPDRPGHGMRRHDRVRRAAPAAKETMLDRNALRVALPQADVRALSAPSVLTVDRVPIVKEEDPTTIISTTHTPSEAKAGRAAQAERHASLIGSALSALRRSGGRATTVRAPSVVHESGRADTPLAIKWT